MPRSHPRGARHTCSTTTQSVRMRTGIRRLSARRQSIRLSLGGPAAPTSITWWSHRRSIAATPGSIALSPPIGACASQRSPQDAPIFRLLLKVAVKGTHQCDCLNFCGKPASQRESTLRLSVRAWAGRGADGGGRLAGRGAGGGIAAVRWECPRGRVSSGQTYRETV